MRAPRRQRQRRQPQPRRHQPEPLGPAQRQNTCAVRCTHHVAHIALLDGLLLLGLQVFEGEGARLNGGWGNRGVTSIAYRLHKQRPTLVRTAAAAAAAAYQDPSPAMTAGGALGSRAGQQPSAYYHAPMHPSSSAHPVVQLVELVDGAVKLVLPAVGVKVLIALPLAHGALDVAAACGQAGQGGSRTTGQKRAAGGDARAG